MTECPVCRGTVTGRPDRCKQCGTPLGRTLNRSGNWWRKGTFLAPGLFHFGKGYLIRGILASFGNIFAILWLLSRIGTLSFTGESILTLLLWTGLWLSWCYFWYRDSYRLRSLHPSPGRILSTVLVLLVTANGLMILIVINVISQKFF